MSSPLYNNSQSCGSALLLSNTNSDQCNSFNHPKNSSEWTYLTEYAEHPPEPFETINNHTSNLPTAVEIDDSEFEVETVDGSDLLAIENELDAMRNLMPRSKQTMQLQDELCRAETEYYNAKTAYFEKLAGNTKIKGTLMLLKVRKLQLEIEKFTKAS